MLVDALNCVEICFLLFTFLPFNSIHSFIRSIDAYITTTSAIAAVFILCLLMKIENISTTPFPCRTFSLFSISPGVVEVRGVVYS